MPHLETERLILRIPSLEDLDRWAEMMADADAARFIGGVSAKPVVWRMIMQMNGAWVVTGVSMFSVLEKSSGRWIGRVGPWQPYGWPGTEVGWGLHPAAWGQGYAVEAATATMDYAFDVLGWTNVVHCINPENARSAAVARRLGSTIQGRANMPVPYDNDVVDLWGQSREEWARNRDRLGVAAARA